MLPILKFASDGKEHALREAREELGKEFALTDEEEVQLLPSGRQAVFTNRVAWAKVYLQRAGLLNSARRGYFQISDRGRQILGENPSRINIRFLERFPEFSIFRGTAKSEKEQEAPGKPEGEHGTPEEALEAAYERLRNELAVELLEHLKASSPQFFERLVVDLLVAMGYGGSRKEAGKAIGKAGDEGIDGIINEDRLGLEVIYLQAKKWEGTVGRPDIQKFVGALHGKRARKGVFMTTGTFSQEATDYVSRIDPKVVLIDGRQLAQHMIDFNLGVTLTSRYEAKKIESDFFLEE
ncbi:MAG: restriction endonuclease [Acidobacteriota bacterium]